MSSLRSLILLFIVALSMTVLAAPVPQPGDIAGTGVVPVSETESDSGSGSPHDSGAVQPGATSKSTESKDDGDALIETIAPVGNGNLNGNKIITSVNTLNDVLSNDLNNSTILSNILSDNDDNDINIGIKRRSHIFRA